MTPEQAEEQVRQDAADRMQHTTTSDLSARLMCRVGFRELTLLLAHYDGLKRAHQPLRIPVELDEATVTLGRRADGRPWLHSHVDWIEADGRRGCGHVLPEQARLEGHVGREIRRQRRKEIHGA